ncbi:reverse transcriptase domain protein, partial [Stagonosporopsis vannaccii]
MTTISSTRATPSSSNEAPPVYEAAPNAGTISVAKPDLYKGDRQKLDEWLLQWDLFFTFQGQNVPEVQRVTLMASHMRDQALKWIKPFIQQYTAGEAPDEVDEWMRDSDRFKDKIRTIFGVINEPSVARRKIQHIQQRQSAADYAADFQQLAANTDWDDTALMTMFRQGLKPRVKEELMRTGASLETLDDLIKETIEIDNRLYELDCELGRGTRTPFRNAISPPRRNAWRNNAPRQGQRGGRYQANSSRRVHTGTNNGYYGPEAMDLSNINREPVRRWNDKGKGSQGKNKSSVTCYGCGKIGHYARDCRDKNKVVRQLNMIVSDQPDDSGDWE